MSANSHSDLFDIYCMEITKGIVEQKTIEEKIDFLDKYLSVLVYAKANSLEKFTLNSPEQEMLNRDISLLIQNTKEQIENYRVAIERRDQKYSLTLGELPFVGKSPNPKWLVSPAIIGFVVHELVTKGYLEFPLRNGEINYAGIAKSIWERFETETTAENLAREINPKMKSLSSIKEVKFKIPQASDMK